MKKKILQAFFCLSAFIFAVCWIQPAFAHGTEPRLEISVERINPGGVLEVRGVDFDYDELIILSLTRSTIQIPLNEVTADVEGVFTQVIVLPPDLPTGEYNFRAKSEHHTVMSPTIKVWGAAVENNESNSIQDQSDVQFGLIPTFAPAVVPENGSLPVAEPVTSSVPPAQNSSILFMLSFLVVVGLLVFTGARLIRKQ